MIIRETKREFSESLPFDFNSSPHLTGIVNILQELKDTSNYDIELNKCINNLNSNNDINS
jgi:hypothetical protein